MPTKDSKRSSPFLQALAARKGDVEAEHLHGAALKIFKDKSLSDDQIRDYANPDRPKHQRPIGGCRRQIQAKRG